jgi:Ca-activated chloride channel family protein
MTMHPKLIFFSCCLSLIPVTSAELQAQPFTSSATFRTASQMVLVPVTVTDRNGKTIDGLRGQDFTILDDQVPQRIVSFSSDDAPSSISIVLDVSGSMRHLLGAAKDIAHVFLGTANPDDEFRLLTVSTQPEAISGFTTDVAAVEQNIASAAPGGFTALIDTIYLGLNSMRNVQHPRRALLVISDGVENHSRYSKAELIRVALEADVQVYTIVLDNPSAASGNTVPLRPALAAKPWDQARQREGPQMLEELSTRTGGLHFVVHKDAEAREAAIKAGRAIRNEYVIGYQPPDSGLSGKWHRVRVKSDIPKVNVYARSGYYSR